jgi:hypothetical protein
MTEPTGKVQTERTKKDAGEDQKLKELEEKGKALLESAPGGDLPLVEEEGEMSPEDAVKKAETLQQKKARIAQVLSRGFVNDKLAMAERLPKDRVGFWVRDRPEDVDRMKALGGRVEERPKGVGPRDVHGTGDNKVRVGDVILMSLPREEYDLIQQVRTERREAKSSKARREYLDKARSNPVVPVVEG